jgi:hypothetical protein|tara:strand:+ start:362 stop:586 length:225 start_codon:yes stop_codon:yes gene_type:complete
MPAQALAVTLSVQVPSVQQAPVGSYGDEVVGGDVVMVVVVVGAAVVVVVVVVVAPESQKSSTSPHDAIPIHVRL